MIILLLIDSVYYFVKYCVLYSTLPSLSQGTHTPYLTCPTLLDFPHSYRLWIVLLVVRRGLYPYGTTTTGLTRIVPRGAMRRSPSR